MVETAIHITSGITINIDASVKKKTLLMWKILYLESCYL